MEATNPKKKMIIMRGLPGSGKSYKAKKLAQAENGIIYSTDDFFETTGKYIYDPSKIGEYHQKNQQRTQEALKNGLPLVIIDNTNIKLWEMKRYVELARQYGYEVDVQTSETDWAWDAEKCAEKNSHGVQAGKLKQMKDAFEQFTTVEDILNSNMPQHNKKPHYKLKEHQ